MKATYIEELAAEIQRHVAPELLPNEDSDSLFLIYSALALAKEGNVQPKDVHDAWAAWMATKHPAHESIKPFATLSRTVQSEDDPFVHAIRDGFRAWQDKRQTPVKS